MRYIILFSFTAILSLVILFYPSKEYLSIYEDKFYIEYDYQFKDHYWKYVADNNNLKIKEINNNKWEFVALKNGITTLDFYYTNSDIENYKYKITYKFEIKNNKIYWLEGEGKGLLDFPNPY